MLHASVENGLLLHFCPLIPAKALIFHGWFPNWKWWFWWMFPGPPENRNEGKKKKLDSGSLNQKTFRYLWRFYSLLFRDFFVAFPWLFRGPLLSRRTLECRKWGCNKWGFKGCLAACAGNRPKSAFFALFLPFSPFSGGPGEHLENPEKGGEKGLFPHISSDLLTPPSLKPPSAALQKQCLGLFRGFFVAFSWPSSV